MKLFISVFLLFFFIACNTEPRPFVAGKDVCSYCKMPVADLRFGGELITKKGKLYFFDDIGCMITFMKSPVGAREKVRSIYVISYTDSRKMLNVNEAVFLKSQQLHSPMNSGSAAFESRSEAESFLKDFPGDILTWQQFDQTFH